MDEQLAIRRQDSHHALAGTDEPPPSSLPISTTPTDWPSNRSPSSLPCRGKNYEISALSTNTSALYGSAHTLQPPFEIRLHFGHPVEPVFGLKIYSDQQHWTEVAFDTNKKEFYIDRTHSGAAISPDFPIRTKAPLVITRPYDLTLIVDRSSVEAPSLRTAPSP